MLPQPKKSVTCEVTHAHKNYEVEVSEENMISLEALGVSEEAAQQTQLRDAATRTRDSLSITWGPVHSSPQIHITILEKSLFFPIIYNLACNRSLTDAGPHLLQQI